MRGNIQHIPAPLRARPQWMVAGPSKAPLGIDASGRTYNGSVNKPADWLGFDAAANYAAAHGLLIGYVLTADDPFTVVDLDWCNAESQRRKGKPVDPSKWSTLNDAERYLRIVEAFDSYTEISAGGFGLHIVVKATIGEGRRREMIEVYSQQRFIVCTGNVLHTKPIEDRQQLIDVLLEDMRPPLEYDAHPPLHSEPMRMSDETVLAKISGHVYAAKFAELWAGRWEKFGYPTRSEADLALMGYIARVSMNNDQCMRLFMRSQLAHRDKYFKATAERCEYLMNHMLRPVRSQQARNRADTAQWLEAMRPIFEAAQKRGEPSAITGTLPVYKK